MACTGATRVCANVLHTWNKGNAPPGPTGSHLLPSTGFDELYAITTHRRAVHLLPLEDGCGKSTQRVSVDVLHGGSAQMGFIWTDGEQHIGRALITRRDPVLPRHGKIMCSLLLYVRRLRLTSQRASPCETTYVRHGWKVDSHDVHPTTAPLITAFSTGNFPGLCEHPWHRGNWCNVSCGRLEVEAQFWKSHHTN